MKTILEMQEWLKSSSKRPVLLLDITNVKVGGSPTEIYISSGAYVTKGTDTPPNISYLPIVSDGISINSSLNYEGNPSVGYGTINILNKELFDYALDFVWTAAKVTIYFGDVSWQKSDFRPVFTGSIVDLSVSGDTYLSLILADKLQRLNNPISEELMDTTDITKDQLKPVTFGEVFNITPVVTNSLPNTLEYQVHNGSIEDVIEVRDNGVPVSITKLNAEGKFRLNQALYGTITCSVQGAKLVSNSDLYSNNPVRIALEILRYYGPSLTRLQLSEIDVTAFTNYATIYTSPVGVHVVSKENVLDVVSVILSSVGLYLYVNPFGQVSLKRFQITGDGTSWVVTEKDIIEDSLSISDKPPVKAATKIAYCKNHTPQTTLAAGIPEAHQPVFAKDWLYAEHTNTVTRDVYELPEEVEAEETVLITNSGATAECLRRNDIWSRNRYVYNFKALPYMLMAELGDPITITSSRLGLVESKSGVIISIDKDWISQSVTIGVLI